VITQKNTLKEVNCSFGQVDNTFGKKYSYGFFLKIRIAKCASHICASISWSLVPTINNQVVKSFHQKDRDWVQK